MTKAAKPKMVDGTLCRDKASAGGIIAFCYFSDGRICPRLVLLRNGDWVLCELSRTGEEFRVQEWSPAEWAEQYKLKPPSPGKKFRASLAL